MKSAFLTRRQNQRRATPAMVLPHGATDIFCHLIGKFGAAAPGGFY
jgi:hypothetical protein